jgi:hypothetical protein
VNLTTYLHLMPGLRMSGVIPLLPLRLYCVDSDFTFRMCVLYFCLQVLSEMLSVPTFRLTLVTFALTPSLCFSETGTGRHIVMKLTNLKFRKKKNILAVLQLLQIETWTDRYREARRRGILYFFATPFTKNLIFCVQ